MDCQTHDSVICTSCDEFYELENSQCVLGHLSSPDITGSSVSSFCSSGCDMMCLEGRAKGPGWYLSEGDSDTSTQLRWESLALDVKYFTVCMWINRDDRSQDVGLLSYGTYPSGKGFMVQMRRHDFHIRAGPNGFGAYDSGNVGWTDSSIVGKWVHTCIVRDGDSQIRYYFNGESAGTPKDISGVNLNPTINENVPQGLNIGSWFEGGKRLKGYVSNIRVLRSDSDSSKA